MSIILHFSPLVKISKQSSTISSSGKINGVSAKWSQIHPRQFQQYEIWLRTTVIINQQIIPYTKRNKIFRHDLSYSVVVENKCEAETWATVIQIQINVLAPWIPIWVFNTLLVPSAPRNQTSTSFKRSRTKHKVASWMRHGTIVMNTWKCLWLMQSKEDFQAKKHENVEIILLLNNNVLICWLKRQPPSN